MIKTFFKNSVIYTVGNILSRGIYILLIPVYTRYLAPGEYGAIDLFMILGSIVTLTASLEITQAVARFYQDAIGRDKATYTSTAFIFILFMYSIYLILSYLFSDIMTLYLLNDISQKDVFLLASVAIASSGVFYFTQNQLKWQIQPKDSVVVSIVNVLIIAFIAVYLLVIQNMKIESIFIGQIVGNITAVVVSMKLAGGSYKFKFVFDKLKEMLSFSYPLVFSGIGVFVAMYIDRIAIKGIMGLEELGIYGLAYRFAAIAGLVMMGFQQSLAPLVYKHYKEKETPQNIASIFYIFSIIAILVISGTILFSKEIVVLMSTEKYYQAAEILPILIISVFFSNMYIFAPGLGIAKKTQKIALVNIAGAFLNTFLNFSLIPLYGLYGAAFATLTSAIVIFSIYVILGQKYYYISINWLKSVLIFVSVLSLSSLIKYFFIEITITNILVKSFFMIIILLILISSIKDTTIFLKKKDL